MFTQILFYSSFFLLVHNITTLNGAGETTTVNYIKQWLEKAFLSKETDLKSLNTLELRGVLAIANEAHNALKQSYVEERRKRLVYQAFIDVSPSAANLFRRCWPLWAGQTPDKREPKNWQTLLLNVENPIIFQLRKKLNELNIATEQFINDMIELELKGNERAHLSLDLDERKEAWAAMENHLIGSSLTPTYVAFLEAVDKLSGKKADIEPNSEDQLFSVVSEERSNYRLLHMPNFPPGIDEESTKEMFLHYTTEPIAVWNHCTKGAYLLFNSFKEAYRVWSDKGVFDKFTNTQKQSVIVDAANYDEFPSMAIKIDLASAGCSIENYKEKVGLVDANAIKRLQTKKNEDFLFVIYSKINLALLHYEKCKEKFGIDNVEFLNEVPTLKESTRISITDFKNNKYKK